MWFVSAARRLTSGFTTRRRTTQLQASNRRLFMGSPTGTMSLPILHQSIQGEVLWSHVITHTHTDQPTVSPACSFLIAKINTKGANEDRSHAARLISDYRQMCLQQLQEAAGPFSSGVHRLLGFWRRPLHVFPPGPQGSNSVCLVVTEETQIHRFTFSLKSRRNVAQPEKKSVNRFVEVDDLRFLLITSRGGL